MSAALPSIPPQGLRPPSWGDRTPANAGPTHADTVDTASLLDLLSQDMGATRAVLGWWRQGAVVARHLVPRNFIPATQADLWAAAMDEAIDQGLILHSHRPGTADGVSRHQQALSRAIGLPVSTVPLPGADTPMGAVILVWPACEAPHDVDENRLQDTVARLSPWLALLRTVEQPWRWSAQEHLLRWWRQHTRPTTLQGRRMRTALATLAVMLLVWPAARDFSGHARIEGREQRLLSAPIDGFIERAHVQPGDTVKAGQPLFELAAQDLNLSRERWRSQVAQHESAYTGAMARSDRSEAAVNLARLEEAQAQLALVEAELQRHRVTAPYDGVVVDGDLSQRIGAPVTQGAQLMTLARSGSNRVIIEIDEHDIGHVAIGQMGGLRVSPWPWDEHRIRVEGITPLVQFREGRRVYDVRASLVDATGDDIRPGLIGSARITLGRSPWIWQVAQGVAERLRMWGWRWWG